MMFTIILYWNAFLGFHGPPVRGATFDAITYDGKTPIYTPVQFTARQGLNEGNIFDVQRNSGFGNVGYFGYHPDTHERREGQVAINNGETKTCVV
jgi:hypothetical protein